MLETRLYRKGISIVNQFVLLIFAMTVPLHAQSAGDRLELTPHHAAESVGDLDRAIKWYQEKLGFKLVLRKQQNPNSEIAWLVIPGYRLDLIHRKGSSPTPALKDHMMLQGWGHIVFSVPDVDRAYAILKARGVVLPEPVATNEMLHIRTCHFPNSEGHWLELYEDVPAK
jgi:catechol 2,3-dioxygenase-like lactoylglutathione lyase family enzyme